MALGNHVDILTANGDFGEKKLCIGVYTLCLLV